MNLFGWEASAAGNQESIDNERGKSHFRDEVALWQRRELNDKPEDGARVLQAMRLCSRPPADEALRTLHPGDDAVRIYNNRPSIWRSHSLILESLLGLS